MRSSLRAWLVLAAGFAPSWATADDVRAGTATDLSVSLYRAPDRSSESLNLDSLGGFALIRETRAVSLPAGESRLRFEGVADGIESESAIVTGLPTAVLEKNRDARVLSPSALVAAALGQSVMLVRTDPKSGRSTRTLAKIRSDADGGVVFESAQGIEALRCSGLAETFHFSAATDLGASPTLSVLVRNPSPLSAKVTLSYLAHGFDWTANYVVTLAPDARSVDIGAWVTLANGNGVSFPSAHTQVIAGRLNRITRRVEPFDLGHGILAQCWPRGSTSDPGDMSIVVRAMRRMANADQRTALSEVMMPAMAAPAPAQLVQEEQLGDLKLYRVPERTSVTSRQIKQVRLLDRKAVPVSLIYRRDVSANEIVDFTPALRMLRTKNDAAHHLGLPLPSGRVATFTARGEATLLLAESPLRDVAVDEEFELGLGESPDVQVSAVREQTRVGPSPLPPPPRLPGVEPSQAARIDDVSRVEIRNATASAIAFELRVRLPDGMQLIAADSAPSTRGGWTVFELTIPAVSAATIRYQTEHTVFRRGRRS